MIINYQKEVKLSDVPVVFCFEERETFVVYLVHIQQKYSLYGTEEKGGGGGRRGRADV